MNPIVYLASIGILLASAVASAADAIPPIKRRVPPAGITISKKDRDALTAKLTLLEAAITLKDASPDVEIFAKAVRFALVNNEFFGPKDVGVAQKILELGFEVVKGKSIEGPLKVFGYRSDVDGSVQPYGVDQPAGLDLTKPVPLYVWLHGRGDNLTDLYFINRQLRARGRIAFDDGITLFPFGRQCIGYKSAGEQDVLDAVADVSKRYKIDPDRIVMMGFSMGGAGAWHLGAHYANRWAAVRTRPCSSR